MMTPEQLEQLEALGGQQFTADEAAIVLGLEHLEDDPAAFRAWRKGQLQQESLVRASLLTLAKQGSAPAQNAYLELAAERRRKEGST